MLMIMIIVLKNIKIIDIIIMLKKLYMFKKLIKILKNFKEFCID
jgi:hypothetical protein